MGIPTTVFESNIIDDSDYCEIIDRSWFNEKFVGNENEFTNEEVGPDYDSMMDDARSKVIHNAVEMTPPRQNIFDKSKNSCFHISPAKEENKLQPTTTTQANHIKKGCNFIIPEKPSLKYRKRYSLYHLPCWCCSLLRSGASKTDGQAQWHVADFLRKHANSCSKRSRSPRWRCWSC